jgi:hypothetical protein
MMRADLVELRLLSQLFPAWEWSSVRSRQVILAEEGDVMRLYWMPAALLVDAYRAELFIVELNHS